MSHLSPGHDRVLGRRLDELDDSRVLARVRAMRHHQSPNIRAPHAIYVEPRLRMEGPEAGTHLLHNQSSVISLSLSLSLSLFVPLHPEGLAAPGKEALSSALLAADSFVA